MIREDAPPRSPAAACARLYRDHAAPVARWLSSLGVPHADVPDLVQEVFLVAHRRLGTFRGDARLETWLYAIALNVARQQRRQVSTRTRLSTAVQAAQPPSPHPLTPERALELMRTAGLIEHIVSRLSPSYRRVFVFQAIEGRSGADIAALTGLRARAVRVRAHRARAQFFNLARSRAGEIRDTLGVELPGVAPRPEGAVQEANA